MGKKKRYRSGQKLGAWKIEFVKEVDPIIYERNPGSGNGMMLKRRRGQFICPACGNTFEAIINNVLTGKRRTCGECGVSLCSVKGCNEVLYYNGRCLKHQRKTDIKKKRRAEERRERLVKKYEDKRRKRERSKKKRDKETQARRLMKAVTERAAEVDKVIMID